MNTIRDRLSSDHLMSRRQALRWAGTAAAGLAMQSDVRAQAFAIGNDHAINLQRLAASKNLIFGAATSSAELKKDPAFAELFIQQCGMLVPSGEIQWKYTQPKPYQPHDFSISDWLYAFASKNGKLMRGHALLYDAMAPTWFDASIVNPRAVLENHIRTKASHFNGRLHSWDVVNEVISPFSARKDGLIENVFFKLAGEDYIERAFLIAAEADPIARRVFSDAVSEGRGPFFDKKRALTIEYLNRLIQKNIPVQYIGIHGHLRSNLDATAFDKFLGDCVSLGLKIIVSELDVFDTRMPADTRFRDAAVATVAKEFLNIVLARKETTALLCWGLSDRYTWVSKYAPRPDGLPVRPLPFDGELKPKPMVKAIADAIRRAPVRP